MNINVWTGTGNLGQDVELRYTSNSKPVTNLRLAVNNGYGEKKKTTWIEVVVWDKQAELCNQYLKKGSKVGVSGRLQSREYEKNGQVITVIEVVAEKIEFLDARDVSGNHTNAAAAGADTEETIPF